MEAPGVPTPTHLPLLPLLVGEPLWFPGDQIFQIQIRAEFPKSFTARKPLTNPLRVSGLRKIVQFPMIFWDKVDFRHFPAGSKNGSPNRCPTVPAIMKTVVGNWTGRSRPSY